MMSHDQDDRTEAGRRVALDRIEGLLTTYGCDMSRWPEREARRYERMLDEDAAARRLVVEAAALDRLTDVDAARADPRTVALAERIMAALPAPAIAAKQRPRTTTMAMADWGQPIRSRPFALGLRTIGAGMLLAASLVVGMVAGAIGSDLGVAHVMSDRLGVVEFVKGEVGVTLDTTAQEEEDVL